MTDLLLSPWSDHFDRFVDRARSSLVLCAPFIGSSPCRRIIEGTAATKRADTLSVSVLTDLSRDNMLSGATDVEALLELKTSLPNTSIRFLPSLHAKAYVADEEEAIVTSSNLTHNGLTRNFEYGVVLTDLAVVRQVRTDLLQYASLGSPIDAEQLNLFATITADLRGLNRAAQRSLSNKLKKEFERRVAKADIEILRVRAAGRTAHAIFADAILHVLRFGPQRTVDIHRHIQAIHPDLCDDSVDRVIDGRHFGKKWKHHVRMAQVYLRRGGKIKRVGDKWQLVST